MVKFLGLCLIVVASLAGFASDVRAEEQLMVLWPKQRASHQGTMDAQAQHYQSRGQQFVDHLYATGGEEPMAPDAELIPSEIDPQSVQVDDVARIIRDEATGQGSSGTSQ